MSTAERIAKLVGVDTERVFPVDPPYARTIAADIDELVLNRLAVERPRFVQGPIELFGMRIDLTRCSWDESRLSMQVVVPDRDTGAPLSLDFNIEFGQRCETEEELAECLITGIANVLAHELAEMLRIRGVRFDPHGRPPFFRMKPFERTFQKLDFGFIFGGADVAPKAPTPEQLKGLEGERR